MYLYALQQNTGKIKWQTPARKLSTNLNLTEFITTKSQRSHQPLVTTDRTIIRWEEATTGNKEIANCSNKREIKFITTALSCQKIKMKFTSAMQIFSLLYLATEIKIFHSQDKKMKLNNNIRQCQLTNQSTTASQCTPGLK